jgi:P-type Ca2+ transporter type 2B
MLWVNLIMDTCGALALATEPPTEDILDHPPYKRSERIVTSIMWRNILGQAIFQITVLLVLLFGGRSLFGYTYDRDLPFFIIDPIAGTFTATEKTEHYTLIFNTFVFMQVFNEINARKLGLKEYNIFHGFFNNFLFLGIILGTILVQYFLVQYGGVPIRTSPLTMNQHLLCVGIGIFSWIQGVIIKAILPATWFEWLHFKEDIMTDEEDKQSLVASLKGSFRQ